MPIEKERTNGRDVKHSKNKAEKIEWAQQIFERDVQVALRGAQPLNRNVLSLTTEAAATVESF